MQEIKIRDLQEGDTVLHVDGAPAYTILEIVSRDDGLTAEIVWADGGRDIRSWTRHPDMLDEVVDVMRAR